MLLIEHDTNLIVAHAIVTYDLRLYAVFMHMREKGIAKTKVWNWLIRGIILKIKMNPDAYKNITSESYMVLAGLQERLKQNYLAWLLFNKYNYDYAHLKFLLGADFKVYLKNYHNYKQYLKKQAKNAGNMDFFCRLVTIANPHKKLTLESIIHLYRTYTTKQVSNKMWSAIAGTGEGYTGPKRVIRNHKKTLKRWTGLDFHKVRELKFEDIKKRAIERFYKTRFERGNMDDFLRKEYSKKSSEDYAKTKKNGFEKLILWSEKKKCKTYEEFRELAVSRTWTKINYTGIPKDILGDMDVPPCFKYKGGCLGNGKRYERYKQLFT